MNPDDRDLLKGILHSDGLDDFRQASLECGLNVIRQRRRRRAIAKTCAVVALPVFTALVALWNHDLTWSRNGSISSSPARAAASNSSSNVELTIINDEQLFALFPNHALALVGKPGHQQLVFLDQLEPQQPAIAR